MGARRARDSKLLDAIEAVPVTSFAANVWRVVADGRNPLQCSSVGGRWDDRTFDVLYTSTADDGAMAEMYFHLSRGQPVIPSKRSYRLFELHAAFDNCVQLDSLDKLAALGLSTSTFGKLSYVDRDKEYPRSQEIAEAAHFHERCGLLVPSARSEHANLVVFCDNAGPAAVEVVKDHGPIVWEQAKSRARSARRPSPEG